MESSAACRAWLLKDVSEKQLMEALQTEEETSSSGGDNESATEVDSLVRISKLFIALYLKKLHFIIFSE